MWLYHNLVLDDLLLLDGVDQVVLLQVGLTVRVLGVHEAKSLSHAISVCLKTLHIFEVHIFVAELATRDEAVCLDWPQACILSRSA